MADSFLGDIAKSAGDAVRGVSTSAGSAITDAGARIAEILAPLSASLAESANEMTLDVVEASADGDTVMDVTVDGEAEFVEAEEDDENEEIMTDEIE